MKEVPETKAQSEAIGVLKREGAHLALMEGELETGCFWLSEAKLMCLLRFFRGRGIELFRLSNSFYSEILYI